MIRVLLAFVFALIASAAQAQVVNPKTLEFDASADHNVMVGGVPAVDHYDLNILVGNAAGAMSFTKGLGKPTPNAQNRIIFTDVPEFITRPRGTYVVTIAAVSGGQNPTVGVSLPSNPFVSIGTVAVPGVPVVK